MFQLLPARVGMKRSPDLTLAGLQEALTHWVHRKSKQKYDLFHQRFVKYFLKKGIQNSKKLKNLHLSPPRLWENDKSKNKTEIWSWRIFEEFWKDFRIQSNIFFTFAPISLITLNSMTNKYISYTDYNKMHSFGCDNMKCAKSINSKKKKEILE